MVPNIEVIVGTYEEFVLGYKIDKKDEEVSLVQSFADKSHSGSIKCVAVHDRWVATGGTDDRIFIYDMKTRKQSQILLGHEGTINSMAFTPDGTHLLSAADDGRMIATRLKTWFTDATWKKAHSGAAVTHVSCHPSGKLALSLGSDLILRTWNLVKGRVAYKTNLKSRNTLGSLPDCLTWSPTGDYFTLSGQRIVEFWSIKTADVMYTQKTKSKPICLAWVADNTCLVGQEDGKILWLTIKDEKDTTEKEIAAHNSRVKTMCVFKDYLVTASSSGEIKLWQVLEKKQNLKEIATANSGCRPTAIGVLDLEQFGANYVISSTMGSEVKAVAPSTSKAKPAPQGVVTIEYDNEEDVKSNQKTDSSNDEDDDDDDDSDEDEDSTDGEEDIADDQDDSENDADSVAEEESRSSKDVEAEEESTDEEGEEVQREQVTRKHKLHVTSAKEHSGNKRTKQDKITTVQTKLNKQKRK